MKHRNSHFAIGYWTRIRHGRPAPDQADIDPKALKRLLPFVFILDGRVEGALIYRLAGTTLCERFGGELRGRNFLSHWDPDSRSRLSEVLCQSLRTRTPVALMSIAATDDCHMIEIETVLMPITFGGGEPERFLGIAQVLTDVTVLGGRPLTFERLVASAFVHEEEEEDTASVKLPPATPEERPASSRPRAPHLRLVISRTEPAPSETQAFNPEAFERLFPAFGHREPPAE